MNGLTIFEHPDHLTADEVQDMYPGVMYVMQIQDYADEDGKLLAICDDIRRDKDFDNFIKSLPKEMKVLTGGSYGEVSFGVLPSFEE